MPKKADRQAQGVESLSSKYEALSPIPSTTKKKKKMFRELQKE
jgi:hypothetical protein